MGLGGLCAWIALLEPSLAAASPPAPSFSEAWYREVVLGELAAAGDLYRKIYEDGGAAPSKAGPSPEVRRKAALRAGGCFEKVGREDLAAEAYSWLVRTGPAEDPSVRCARLKVLAISRGEAGQPASGPATLEPPPAAPPASSAAPAPVASPAAAAARPEVFPALERLRQRVERREASAGDLKVEAAKLAQKVQEERRLRRRLTDLGVELRLDVAAAGKDLAGSPLGDPLRGLDPEDRSLLSPALAEGYYLRGLRALWDRDPAEAVEEFQKVLEVHPDYRDAADLLQAAKGFLRPMEGVSKLAALRLSERRRERELETVRAMRAALARADLLISQDQGPAALTELERARSEVEWPPARVLRTAEVNALAREADIRTLLASAAFPPSPATPAAVGVGVQRYEELRARGRKAIEDLVAAAEELTDLSWSSTDRRNPTPAGKEDGEVQRRVGEELERLLVRGEDKYRQKPQDRSQDGWRREFLDIKILAQWFPDSDLDQRFRKLAQEYLER